MTIKEAQELVDAWNGKHGIRPGELTGLALLTEKVGELARAVAQRHGEAGLSPGRRQVGEHPAMAEELGEVLWALLSLSAQSGADLSEAVIGVLEKKNRTK